MKLVISKKKILSEYNKIAKIKISIRGAEILQEEAKQNALRDNTDAYIEVSKFETKDGITHIIS